MLFDDPYILFQNHKKHHGIDEQSHKAQQPDTEDEYHRKIHSQNLKQQLIRRISEVDILDRHHTQAAELFDPSEQTFKYAFGLSPDPFHGAGTSLKAPDPDGDAPDFFLYVAHKPQGKYLP